MSSAPRTRFRPRGSVWAWLLVGLIAVGLVAAVATGAVATLFPPIPATEEGRQISDLYTVVFVFAAAIFLAVEGLIVWTVIRYRRRPGDDELPPQTHGNNVAEIAWTVIPMVIVVILFVVSWQTLNDVEAVSDRPDLVVEVTGGQFSWRFNYPDAPGGPVTQTVSGGEGGALALPVGRKIQFRMTSADVIHSFYVPAFLFKRDVNPDPEGRATVFETTILPEFAGQTLHGQCAELCGIGHRRMTFPVLPMTDADFAAWLEQARPQPTGTPPPVETTLDLSAEGIAFGTKALEVPADAPFAIDFTNADQPGVPHDIDIRASDGSVLQDQREIDGGEATTYTYEGLEPGTYTFICSIHPVPAMTGTLTAN